MGICRQICNTWNTFVLSLSTDSYTFHNRWEAWGKILSLLTTEVVGHHSKDFSKPLLWTADGLFASADTLNTEKQAQSIYKHMQKTMWSMGRNPTSAILKKSKTLWFIRPNPVYYCIPFRMFVSYVPNTSCTKHVGQLIQKYPVEILGLWRSKIQCAHFRHHFISISVTIRENRLLQD